MIKKKIYDIIPPRKREEILGRSEKVLVKKSARIEDKKEKKQQFVFSKKRGLFVSVLIIFAIVIYWFFSVATVVRIELFPHIDKLTLNANVVFSTSSSEFLLSPTDLSETIIPAVPVEIEKTFTKEFSSSEVSVEEKAKGIIRIYNKHTRTVSLVEGTRFLSSSEPARQFHIQQKATIPVGGYIDAPVIASEAGDEYNIEQCVFSVPGLRNFAPPQLYYDIFGRSFSNMEGGRKNIVYKVTEESFENAKKQLLEVARQEIKAALEDEVGPDFEILDDSIELELIEGMALNAKEGQEMDVFLYEIKVKAKGLKIRTNFLLEFAKEYAISSLSASKDFIEELLTVKFLPEEKQILGGATDIKGKDIKGKLEISINVYSKIDKDSLKEIARGRGKRDIARYALEICPGLLKPPVIEFKPFWARSVAAEPTEVEVIVMFE